MNKSPSPPCPPPFFTAPIWNNDIHVQWFGGRQEVIVVQAALPDPSPQQLTACLSLDRQTAMPSPSSSSCWSKSSNTTLGFSPRFFIAYPRSLSLMRVVHLGAVPRSRWDVSFCRRIGLFMAGPSRLYRGDTRISPLGTNRVVSRSLRRRKRLPQAARSR